MTITLFLDNFISVNICVLKGTPEDHED
jgi:hypothetical protein